jgi:hypothetical protein
MSAIHRHCLFDVPGKAARAICLFLEAVGKVLHKRVAQMTTRFVALPTTPPDSQGR